MQFTDFFIIFKLNIVLFCLFFLNNTKQNSICKRPSLSDQIKVGFYSSDRYTQTNESEILNLKNATNDLEYLCREIISVKNDLKFAKNSSVNQFQMELNSKSIDM